MDDNDGTGEGIRDLARKAFAETTDVNTAADLVLSWADRDLLAGMVRPLVRDECRRVLRTMARRAEGQAAKAIRRGEPRAAVSVLAGQVLALPTGRVVSTLEATAEEHRLYARWCRGQACTLVETAERHELFASVIESAGVGCLGEVDDLGDLEG